MKTIVITGATGFVGKKLTVELLKRGYDIRVVSRDEFQAKKVFRLPVSFHQKLTPAVVENTHAVIHLAGENVAAKRWSLEQKKKILDSRTKATDKLIETISQAKNPPKIFVSASAVGIYGDRGSESLTESSSLGSDFLAGVCKAWESSGEKFPGRKVFLRTGIVLGYEGALAKMLPPFRFGAGGKLSTGKQWMSWIHIDDLVAMYIWAMETESATGAYNAVAPAPVTNAEFTKTLSATLNRPALFPVPALALKILFGEMSEVLLASQRVFSEKMKNEKFTFHFPNLTAALTNLLRPMGLVGAYVFENYQWIPAAKTSVFSFFAEAKNLEVITPPWLNFKILNSSTPDISQGTLIDYKLKIKGVPAKWKTLISRWDEGNAFVDEQLKGPYKTWHHTHEFLPLKDGTLMHDRVVYRMPFSLLGDVVKIAMVEKDVRMIFGYRSKIIDRLSF